MRYIPSNTPKSVAADSTPTIPAIPYLLLPVPDTDFREYLEEVISLADTFPEIITSIDSDLDRHAKEKKALRLADQRFFDNQTPDHPGLEFAESEIIPAELSLQTGRPRMQPLLVFVVLIFAAFSAPYQTNMPAVSSPNP